MFKLADQPKILTSKFLHTAGDWEQLVHSPSTPPYYISHFTHTHTHPHSDCVSIRRCFPLCKEQQYKEHLSCTIQRRQGGLE